MAADLLIDTPHLQLRWPDAEQIDGLYEAVAGTSIWDTVMWDGPASVEVFRGWWQRRQWDAGDPAASVVLGIVERGTGACVGSVELPAERDPRIRDLGYLLAPQAHGRGYATEAVGALVDHAFTALGAERVHCTIFANNPASRRVAEKVGLRLEGTERRAVCKGGVWLDKWRMGVVRPDWEASRG